MTTSNYAAMMAMPLGIIEQVTDDGAIFVMCRPTDSEDVSAGQPVTVWEMDQTTGARARYRGVISEIGDTVGAFIIRERDIDEGWPRGRHPVVPGNPVYLAMPDSYDPDPSRTGTLEEAELLADMAREFEEQTGVNTGAAVYVPARRAARPEAGEWPEC